MESITKNRQDIATLRAMIERAYGADEVPVDDGFATEMHHGWFNVVYRVLLRGGREVMLKIAPPRSVEVMTYEIGALQTEVAALVLLAERLDVRVPAVEFVDETRELCDAPYLFMDVIPGEVVGVLQEEGRITPEDLAMAGEAQGRVTAAINAIAGERFGRFLDPRENTWREAFARMLAEVLDDGERRGVDLGVPYADVRDVFTAHGDALDTAPATPVLVEWDLWLGNLLIEDGALSGVIDHERVVWGDPIFEAGFVACVLPAVGDPADFLRGYGRGALTPDETARRLLYNAHLFLIMVIETVFRGHTDTKQCDWARAQLLDALLMLGYGARRES